MVGTKARGNILRFFTAVTIYRVLASTLTLLLFFALPANPQSPAKTRFLAYLESRLKIAPVHAVHSASNGSRYSFCEIETDPFSARILYEYGAMFSAADSIAVPDRCFFSDEVSVSRFQSNLTTVRTDLDGTIIVLQLPAMSALLTARSEAAAANRRITPLDGSVAGRRSYADTVRIWNLRFLRALDYWTSKGKISPDDAAAARSASVPDQGRRVMEWESRGWFFNTGYSRTIFQSVAPPGTSQHLSMVAFDVVEHQDSRVREILARHGWYQTIANDPPHFTFLGVPESELPSRGLRAYRRGARIYWIPDTTPVDNRPTTIRAALHD